MSERYTKLFSLPENLYAETSPVVIAAGALLKDNATGKVLAQLKFRNITGKTVKALCVRITPLDTVGAPLGEAVSHQYLDLSAGRNDDFGQKVPVTLPDTATRAFSASMTEAIFADNSLWSGTDAPWEPLPAPQPLSLGDRELEKQYRIKFGEISRYQPMEHKDLWYCACGVLNTKEDSNCHKCRNSRDGFFSLDMDALKAAKDERLAAEAKKAAEEKAAAEAAAKKVTKVVGIIAAVAAVVIAATALVTQVIFPASRYKAAEALLDAGEYDAAIEAFEALDDYRDSADRIEEAEDAIQAKKDAAEEAANAAAYAEAEELLGLGNYAAAAIAFNHLGGYSDSAERSTMLWDECVQRNTIAASSYITMGLKTDGTVVTNMFMLDNEFDLGWNDIVDIACGYRHRIGLKSNGTVMAAGDNDRGQCDVASWQDVVAVSADAYHTVGLKSNGTVVATGDNDHGQCDVEDWIDIAAVACGYSHTVGLKTDGTVVSVGSNDSGLRNVYSWKNINAIAAGGWHTVGLKTDGTVVAVGLNVDGRCNVSNWNDIVAIAASNFHTVGLKSDGSVVAVGLNDDGQCDVEDWMDIVAVAAGNSYTVGLKSDGTVVAVGENDRSQCDVDNWTEIKLPS